MVDRVIMTSVVWVDWMGLTCRRSKRVSNFRHAPRGRRGPRIRFAGTRSNDRTVVRDRLIVRHKCDVRCAAIRGATSLLARIPPGRQRWNSTTRKFEHSRAPVGKRHLARGGSRRKRHDGRGTSPSGRSLARTTRTIGDPPPTSQDAARARTGALAAAVPGRRDRPGLTRPSPRSTGLRIVRGAITGSGDSLMMQSGSTPSRTFSP